MLEAADASGYLFSSSGAQRRNYSMYSRSFAAVLLRMTAKRKARRKCAGPKSKTDKSLRDLFGLVLDIALFHPGDHRAQLFRWLEHGNRTGRNLDR